MTAPADTRQLSLLPPEAACLLHLVRENLRLLAELVARYEVGRVGAPAEELVVRCPADVAAYLGAVSHQPPNGWAGGAWALVAVFLPSFLLVVGALPFWEFLRRRPAVRAALRGINAAVVGLLLAALYDPVWQSAIRGPTDLALALGAFALLVFWALPPWLVVAISAAASALLS